MNESQHPEARPQYNCGPAISTDYAKEDEIDLARLWGIIIAGKWKISAFVLAALICAVFHLFVAIPLYQTDALLQIQAEGSSPLQGVTSDLESLTGKNSSPAKSEVLIIKSRAVLGETANKLKLRTSAAPVYFPVIGRAVARRRGIATDPDQQSVDAEQGKWLSQYAWSQTDINVTRMDIPEALDGARFNLRALGGGQYVLFGPEGKLVLRGQVGKGATGKASEGGEVQIFVSTLSVNDPPVDFTLVHSAWLPVVQGLQNNLSVSEQGNDTGVVRISLVGENREQITRIVNAVAENYLRQNVEARSKQAQKSLEFLDEQLPELRTQLQAAEGKLAQFREKNQAVDLDAEGQALLDQVVSVEDKRSQLALKLAELNQTYTGKHPAIEAVREQMQSLRSDRQDLEKKVGTLPKAQKEVLSLLRDVEVNTQLYTALLNRAQELRVVKAGTIGNVRIIDEAVEPIRSIGSNKGLFLILAIVLGTILGVGVVFLQAALRRGITDPKDIEDQLGLPVYAVIPFSNWLSKHSTSAHKKEERAPLLARDHSGEIAVEALRSLRTSLFFAQMESDSNVILITGPAPGVGKSFVSANLAYLLADSGKRVVVVDADMRKGRLHEFTETQHRDPGLSQILTGQASLETALRNIQGDDRVKILTSGQIPPNPSELLMRESFSKLLTQLKQDFDLVIIDAPPILAVTDAAVIASTMPGIVTFMVARSGLHPLPELQEAVKRMSRNNRNIAGVVFNALKQTHATYAGGYRYYQYEYKA